MVLTAPRITTDVYGRDGTLRRHLERTVGGATFGAMEPQWDDPPDDIGGASLTVPNHDPALGDVDPNAVLRILVDGAPVFQALVSGIDKAALSKQRTKGHVTKISGPGALAIFGDAVVYPVFGVGRKRFSDARLFNFANPAFDPSGYGFAVATDHASHPTTYTDPANWMDPPALWLWDRPSYITDDPPIGYIYLWAPVLTLADRKVARFQAAADDGYQIWLNGDKVFEDIETGYLGQSKTEDVEMEPGDWYLRVLARNQNHFAAGFRFTMQELDGKGNPIGTLLNSQEDWRVLGYPAEPPGFTPTHVLRLLVDEAQVRGALPTVTLNFTDTEDSGGNTMPVTSDISLQVGMKYVDVIRQLLETYLDKAGITPTSLFELNVEIDTGPGPTGTAFTATTNLTELSHISAA